MFDWKVYTGNLKWLPERTIYLTVHGSRAYGTNIEGSDTDFRGIAIAPREYYIGILNNFEQAIQSDPDLTIFDIKKCFKLCIDANPNALEILFTDDSDHLIETNLFQKLKDNRDLFLSKKAKFTFSGYAASQAKRISGHYRWLKSPPAAPPSRSELGLPDRTLIPTDQLKAAQALIQKQLDSWSWKDFEHIEPATRQAIKDSFFERMLDITKWNSDFIDEKMYKSAANKCGFDSNFIELLDKERLYTNLKKDWDSYQTWKKERNPARAELESKYGYDCKHGSHLVRLCTTCKELLETGKLIVKRPDAEFLKSIRMGAWTYEQLMEWFYEQDKALNVLYEKSTLRHQPDKVKLDQLLMNLIEGSFDGIN